MKFFNTLNSLNVKVIGISGDEPENLKLFKEVHELDFTLLSDPEGEIARLYGVPFREGGSVKKSIKDRDVLLNRGITAARWTFLIGKNGKIIYINNSVNTADDSKNIIKVIQSLHAD